MLQGAAVSGEHISQGPPGNVVALGCSPPSRRVSERSVQTFPDSLPFQDVILTAQLHINPEASLERLVPLVELWQHGNFRQNISRWVLQTIKKGIKYSSDLARPDSLSTEVAPQQVLVMEQEVKALLEKGAIEYVPHSNR